MAVSFIDAGNRSSQRKLPTCPKVNMHTTCFYGKLIVKRLINYMIKKSFRASKQKGLNRISNIAWSQLCLREIDLSINI